MPFAPARLNTYLVRKPVDTSRRLAYYNDTGQSRRIGGWKSEVGGWKLEFRFQHPISNLELLKGAIGSVGERLAHTEEVTGSNPVSPTILFSHRFLNGLDQLFTPKVASDNLSVLVQQE